MQDMDQAQPDLVRRMRDRVMQRLNTTGIAHASLPSADVQQLVVSARESARRIGEFPPSPPTLRGRLGARAVAVTRRALFWLLPSIRSAVYEILSVLDGLINEFQHVQNDTTAMKPALDRLAEKLDVVAERQRALEADKRMPTLQKQLDEFRQDLGRTASDLQQQLANLNQEQALRSPELHLLQQGLSELRQELVEGRQREARLRREIVEQTRRTSILLEGFRKAESAPCEVAREEFLHRLDPLYMSFEDVFRGTRADIKQRLETYLPYLPHVDGPVLDLGCGRGEWMELLRDLQISARGVDWNLGMVGACRELGLDVAQGDLVEYLRGVSSDSIRMITAFHVVEHLEFQVIVQLLDEVARVLKAGGVAVFETPNPGNILVGSYSFYFDPTHRNPIPAPTLQFLVEARGLSDVRVLPPHASPEVYFIRRPDEVPAEAFNPYFCAPWDYAVIGRKV